MPGYLVDVTTKVICSHGATAMPTAPAPRVTILGQAVVTQAAPHAVAGCPNVTPASAPLPCAAVQWLSAATRVTAMGQPVLLSDSKGVATPTGTPPSILPGQIRVQGI